MLTSVDISATQYVDVITSKYVNIVLVSWMFSFCSYTLQLLLGLLMDLFYRIHQISDRKWDAGCHTTNGHRSDLNPGPLQQGKGLWTRDASSPNWAKRCSLHSNIDIREVQWITQVYPPDA